jgi:predicted porin
MHQYRKAALAMGTLLLAPQLAGAQTAPVPGNGVVIYGSVDAGLSNYNDERGAHATQVDTGNRSPDRIGFRGSEDLGNGMRAIFQLENGFNLDDGTMKRANVLFSRYAFVGLASKAGTLSFGHMPDFLYEYMRYTSNGFMGSSYFFHPGNLDNQANQFQLDNAIKYETPTFAGFTFGAMNGFGEQAGDSNRLRSYSLGARYLQGNLRAAAAYTVANNRSLNLGGTLGLNSFLGQTLSRNAAAPDATYTNFAADKQTSAGLTASYKAGWITPHAMATQIKLEARGLSATQRNLEGGADFAIGASNTLGLSLASSRLQQVRWNQLNVIDMIKLSPRTTLYGVAAFQRASGDGAHAVINGAAPASGQSQRVLRVGVHHLF